MVEVLIYMTILTVILSILIGSLIMVAHVQERVIAGKALDRSAVVALDRILREVRLSDSIDRIVAVFDDPESVLAVNSESVTGVIRFYVSEEGSLYVEKEGGSHRLTHRDTEVQVFRVEEIDAGETEAVKVELTLSHSYSSGSIVQSFYVTAILRGSYEE